MHHRFPPLRTLALAACLAITASGVHAAEHTVSQKSKAFSVAKLKVKLGDTVKFVNDDPFSHNVFSLSNTKSFDLGTYGQGGTKTVVFDKAGLVEIECAIHPDMQLALEVAP